MRRRGGGGEGGREGERLTLACSVAVFIMLSKLRMPLLNPAVVYTQRKGGGGANGQCLETRSAGLTTPSPPSRRTAPVRRRGGGL